MDHENHTVRLYTSQADVVVNVIEKEGVCYSKKEFVQKKYGESAKIFTTAYSWFVKEAQKIVPRPEKAEYPYWAFDKLYNVDRSGGGRLLTLNVPVEEVILFDLYDWNKILCMKYLGETEQEEKDFRIRMAQCGISEQEAMLTSFYPQWKQEIQESWSRLFRYDRRQKAGEETQAGGIQAGLWRIRKEWIVSQDFPEKNV